MPLQRRLPKRGFRNPGRREFAIVNLEQIEQRFEAGSVVDPATLCESGLVRKTDLPVKVLGMGTLSKAVTVKAHRFSESARARIVAVGGTAEDIVGA